PRNRCGGCPTSPDGPRDEGCCVLCRETYADSREIQQLVIGDTQNVPQGDQLFQVYVPLSGFQLCYGAPRQINVCQLQFGGQLFLRHTLGDSQSTQPRAELLVNLMIHTIILLLFWCKYVWILSVRSCKIAPI